MSSSSVPPPAKRARAAHSSAAAAAATAGGAATAGAGLGVGVGIGVGSCTDANFPRDAEGRAYHLGLKIAPKKTKGAAAAAGAGGAPAAGDDFVAEAARRVLCVGAPDRARRCAALLDPPEGSAVRDPDAHLVRVAMRGFVVYTGRFRGVPVTVVATGMGMPNTDFVLREISAAVPEESLALIRLGTCGTPSSAVPVGAVAVASHGAFSVVRNVDAWSDDEEAGEDKPEGVAAAARKPNYLVSRASKPDRRLTELLLAALGRTELPAGTGPVVEGMNASCDSFYGSQGRQDPAFDDRNATLVDDLVALYPDLVSIEMETSLMFHLARCSHGALRCAGCAIVLAQRRTQDFLDNERKFALEDAAGAACLHALVEYTFEDEDEKEKEKKT